jgi:hypothetical protein
MEQNTFSEDSSSQLVNGLPAFYGNKIFIAAFTYVCYRSLLDEMLENNPLVQ